MPLRPRRDADERVLAHRLRARRPGGEPGPGEGTNAGCWETSFVARPWLEPEPELATLCAAGWEGGSVGARLYCGPISTLKSLPAEQLAVGDVLPPPEITPLRRSGSPAARRAASRRGRAAPGRRPRPQRVSACRPSLDCGAPGGDPWFGVMSVSFVIGSTWPKSRLSSSAAIISEAGHRALAELDLPELDRGGVVGVDHDPRVDRSRVRRAERRELVRIGRRGRATGQRGAEHREADDQSRLRPSGTICARTRALR